MPDTEKRPYRLALESYFWKHVSNQSQGSEWAISALLDMVSTPHLREFLEAHQSKDEGLPVDQELEALTAWAAERKLHPSDLDESIHDLVSGEASAINNEGLSGQLAALLNAYGPEQARLMLEGIEGSGT